LRSLVLFSICICAFAQDKPNGTSSANPAPNLTAREIFLASLELPPKSGPSKHPGGHVRQKSQPTTSESSSQPAQEQTQTAARETGGSTPAMSATILPVSMREPLGIRYTVLQRTDSGRTEISPDTLFHSGDHIQLKVEANEDGYLYIINRGASGTWRPLFPSGEASGPSNRISRARSYVVPEGYQFTFDENAGEEKLFLVFSREPEPSLENLIRSLSAKASGKPAKATSPAKAPEGENASAPDDVQLASNTKPVDDAFVDQLRDTYSRDLIVEKADDSANHDVVDHSAYAVNPSGSQEARVVADITLKHN